MSPLSSLLPPAYAKNAEHEAKQRSQAIASGLRHALENRTGKARHWVNALQQHLRLKYSISTEERDSLAGVCLDLLQVTADIDLQVKIANCTSSLLKQGPGYRTGSALKVQWRPMLDLYSRAFHEELKGGPEATTSTEKNDDIETDDIHVGVGSFGRLASSLRRLLERCRAFFVDSHGERDSVVAEILDAVLPKMMPLDSYSCALGQGLLTLFLPSHTCTAALKERLLPKCMEMWSWVEGNAAWDHSWMSLLARIARDQYLYAGEQMVSVNGLWEEDVIKSIFSKLLRCMDVAVASSRGQLGKGARQELPGIYSRLFSPSQRGLQSRLFDKAATWIVFALHTPDFSSFEANSVAPLFRRLFASLSTYYHPSNSSGAWSGKLAALLDGICCSLEERVNVEKNNADEYPSFKGGDRSLFLSEDALDSTIDVLLPLSVEALYSKDGGLQNAAQSALRALSWLSPALVLKAAQEQVYEALQSVTSSYKAPTAISLLSHVAIPMVQTASFDGASMLRELLPSILPGIDTNDKEKTTATLATFYAFLSAKEDWLHAGLEDWGSLFLARLSTFFEHERAPNDSSSSSRGEKMRSMVFDRLLLDTLSAFFARTPSASKRRIFDRVWKELGSLSHASSEASHWYKIVAEALPHLDASLAIQKAVQALSTLLDEEAGKTVFKTDCTDSEITWRLSILGAAIRGLCSSAGTSLLLAHDNFVAGVVSACLLSRQKARFEAGLSLLGNAMAIACHSHVATFSKVQDGGGALVSLECIAVAWNEPSVESIQWASSMVDNALSAARSLLTDNDMKDMSVKETNRQSLAVIKALEETAGPLFSAAASPPDLTDPYNLPCTVGEPLAGAKADMWRRSVEEILSLVMATVEKSQDDVNSLTAWCSAAGVHLASFGGAMANDWTAEEWLYRARKHKYFAFLSGNEWESRSRNGESLGLKRRMLRSVACSRVEILHQKRLKERNGLAFKSSAAEHLLECLRSLSFHLYVEVRKAAQKALTTSLVEGFHDTVHDELHYFISTLATPPASSLAPDLREAQVKGCLHLLTSRALLRKVAKNRRLQCEFLEALLSTQALENPTVQTLVLQGFLAFSALFYTLPWHPLVHNNPSDKADIKAEATTVLHECLANILGLLSQAGAERLHWRYRMMASTSLLLLLRSPRSLSDQQSVDNFTAATSVMLGDLTAPVPVIRQVALVGLVRVISWLSSTSANGAMKTVRDSVASSLSLAFTSAEWCSSVLSLIAEEHHFATEAEEAQSSRSNGIQALLSRFNLDSSSASLLTAFLGSNSGQGGGHDELLKSVMALVASLATHKAKHWPATWAILERSPFSVTNCHFFAAVLQLIDCDSRAVLQGCMATMATASDQKEQVTAFELMAAFSKSSLLSDAAAVEFSSSGCSDVISQALYSPLGNSSDLATSIRFVLSLPGAEQLLPAILDAIGVTGCASPQSRTVSQLNRQVECFRAVAAEVKTLSSLGPLLEHIRGHFLSHPYLSVRIGVSRLLAELTRSSAFSPTPVVDSLLDILKSQPGKNLADQNSVFKRETLLLLLLNANSAGVLSRLPQLPSIVAAVLKSVCDPSKDVSTKARAALALLAQAPFSSDDAAAVVATAIVLSQDDDWRVRGAALPFLQLRSFFDRMDEGLGDNQTAPPALLEAVLERLEDENIEVRELASDALASLQRGREHNSEELLSLAEKFEKNARANRPTRKRRGKKPVTTEDAPQAAKMEGRERRRHAAVLGLAALVRLSPYAVPAWLPQVLMALSEYNNDAPSVSRTVREAFQEFWRTHQDQWPSLRITAFTSEQADTISDMLISPSYYG